MTKTEPLQITPGSNIRWEQSYGIGREYHWCLVSDESDKEGKCINSYTVLFSSCDADMSGNPLDEQPDLELYVDAHNTYNALPVLPSELKRRLEEAEADRAALLKERDEAMRLVMQSEGVLIEARVYVDANRDDVRGEYITDTWEEDVERSVSNINATLGSISDFLSILNTHPSPSLSVDEVSEVHSAIVHLMGTGVTVPTVEQVIEHLTKAITRS